MITGQDVKVVYDTTGGTTFPVPFFFFDPAHLVVSTVSPGGAETFITSGYAVFGAQQQAGGTVVFEQPPPLGLHLVIRRHTTRTQETEYPEGGKFPSRTVETDFDKVVAITQELTEEMGRALLMPPDGSYGPGGIVQELLKAREDACECADQACECAEQACACATQACACGDQVQSIVDELIAQTGGMMAYVPIGSLAEFPVDRVPPGYLVCAGQTVTRAAYPDLVTYLTGSPTAPSAVLPDLRLRFTRGADMGKGGDPTVTPGSTRASSVGPHPHEVSGGAGAGHTHTFRYHTGAGVGSGGPNGDGRKYLTSSMFQGSENGNDYYVGLLNSTNSTVGNTGQDAIQTATDSVGPATGGGTGDLAVGGGGTGPDTYPAYYAVVKCIKAYYAPMNAAPVDVGEIVDAVAAERFAWTPADWPSGVEVDLGGGAYAMRVAMTTGIIGDGGFFSAGITTPDMEATRIVQYGGGITLPEPYYDTFPVGHSLEGVVSGGFLLRSWLRMSVQGAIMVQFTTSYTGKPYGLDVWVVYRKD
ncbi:phage tail protein [Nitratidesulfovibrio termitidis]|uniref:phage tail protein n=1 Tax=Nitratidesulfovibrio termitidis TaxID=42252 RepID=UPI0004173FBF|nr:phage tail protein [Nitratidesulfovibrio termitidis]